MQPLRRILLADDDKSLRHGVVDLLSELDIEVLEAENGPEAVELGRRFRLHAALLDLHMPGCDGLQVLPHLLEFHRGLPCIVYSGHWTPLLAQEAMHAGAFAVLHKPVDPLRLRNEMRRALALWDNGGTGLELPG
jgi:two-component system, NtrC family, nitrogen regulation response regulator NtrX